MNQITEFRAAVFLRSRAFLSFFHILLAFGFALLTFMTEFLSNELEEGQ